jgi:hypothetical protein
MGGNELVREKAYLLWDEHLLNQLISCLDKIWLNFHYILSLHLTLIVIKSYDEAHKF